MLVPIRRLLATDMERRPAASLVTFACLSQSDDDAGDDGGGGLGAWRCSPIFFIKASNRRSKIEEVVKSTSN